MKDCFGEFVTHFIDRVLIDHHKPVKQLLVGLLDVKSLNVLKVFKILLKFY